MQGGQVIIKGICNRKNGVPKPHFQQKKSTSLTLNQIYKLQLQTLDADRDLYVTIPEYSCKNKKNIKVFLLLIRRNGNVK